MADIVINPSVGKIDFFTTKGDQSPANTMLLSASLLLFNGPLSASSILSNNGGSYVTTISPTINYLSKFTSTSSIGNSIIYDNGTNIGIGTTSPTQLLELKKTTGSVIALLNYNDSVKFNINASSAGVGYVGMVSNHDLLFVTNDTERARLTSTGCVGIGTTSVRLNSLLTVYGSGAFGTSAYGFYVGTDATGTFLDAGTQLIRMFAGQVERIRIATDGNVGIGTTTIAARLHVNSTTAGATLLRTDGTNGTLFSVVDDLSDSLMSVNNSAGLPVLEVFADDRIVGGQYGTNDFVVVNNKIGVGTNNPANKLTVSGSTSIGESYINTSAPTNGLIVQGNVGIGITNFTCKLAILGEVQISSNSAYTTHLNYQDSGINFITMANGGYTDFRGSSNNITTMRVKGDGNVGIGTSSPTAKLHVSGSVEIDGLTTNATGYYLTVDNTTGVVYKSTATAAGSSGTSGSSGSSGTSGSSGSSGTSGSSGSSGTSGSSGSSGTSGSSGSSGTSGSSGSSGTSGSSGSSGTSGSSGSSGTSGSSGSSGTSGSSGSSGTSGSSGSSGTSGSSGSSGTSGSSGSSGTSGSSGSSGTSVTVSGVNNYVVKFNSTTTITTSSIFDNGNIGIGNTTPAYKLDVFSSIVSRSNISTPRFSNAGTYVYGVTNSPTWVQSCGSAVNNNATAPDGTTSAGTYTFTSTCGSYDLFQTISGLTNGRVYTIGMWVKLGTATNFCLVVNNTAAWNTIGGKAFTSSDGLSTSKWTHISFTFAATATGAINLHLGYHAETAVTQQTAGTVFLWNIEMTEFSSTWIGNVEDEIRLPGSSIWTSRGNVGIGITSPNAKLDVSGVIRGDAGANYPHSFTNTDSGNTHWVDRFGRLLTSNGTNWTADGRDPIMALVTSGNSNNLNIANSIGLALHNESQTNNTFSPAITFSNRSNSGDYNTTYAAIIGRKTGQGVDANWSAGELHFYTMPVGAYVQNVPSMLINSAGNVGIGTTSPAYKLDVNGPIGVAGLRFVDQSTNYFRIFEPAGNIAIYLGNAADPTNYYDNTGHTFRNRGGSSVYAYINSNGNLGIGTTNVTDKLSIVNGNISLSDSYKLYNGSAADSAGLFFSSNQVNISGFSGIIFRSSTTNIPGQTERMRITNGGNIGIGTTTPSASLHTVSSTAGATLLRADGTSGTLFSVVDDLTDSLMSVNNSAGLPVFEVFTDDRIVAGQYGQNDFVITNNKVGIGTNNPLAELHVTSSTSIPSAIFMGGNVGIGTSSPGVALHVERASGDSTATFKATSGGAEINLDATNGYAALKIYSSGTEKWRIGQINDSTGFQIFQGGTGARVYINSSGNVGIGTTSPLAMVHVESSNSQGDNKGLIYLKSTSGTNVLKIGVDGTNNFTELRAYNPGAGDNSKLIFQPYGGSVGIGTTGPTNKFEVETGADDTTGIRVRDSANGVRTEIRRRSIECTGGDFWINGQTSWLDLRTGNTSRLYIGSNGNVGIGTTSPSALLDVSGSLKCAGKFVQHSTTQSITGTGQTLTLNVAAAAVHIVSMASGATVTTISYTNRDNNPAVNTLMLVVKYAGTASITFTNVIWANGATPTLTGTNAFADVFMFTSYQGGAGTPVWIGTVVAQALVSTNL